jgi:hypothetical protein
MNTKYLPSRKFVASVIIIVIGVSLIFGIYKLTIYLKNRVGAKKGASTIIVKDLVQKDTNQNGIPDWEESLWGVDPTINGASNKEFIVAERAKLAKNGTQDFGPQFDQSAESAQNIELSREFFSVILSLQQSGNLDEASIQAVSDTLGQKITANPIPDIYTRKMLTVQTTTSTGTETYVKAVGALMNKYKDKGLGDELNLIAQGLMKNDSQATTLAGTTGKAYRSFGQELIKIPVPYSLIDLHLTLANDYEKVGQSVDGLTKILTDPIVGMKALINYKKYSDALVIDIGNLSDNY